MKPLSIPIENLHLETGVILLFLVMVVRTEFGRASEADYDVLRGAGPLRFLPFLFLFMAILFTGLLHGASPLLGFEIAAGITLSMFHPANALCFLVHLMFLRPWDIDQTNPVLKLVPRFGAMLVLLSWMLHPKQRAHLSWRSLRGVLFLAGFSAWLLLSTLKAPSVTAAMADYYDMFFKSLTIFTMALLLIESERSVREVQLTLVISSLSLLAAGLYQFLTIGLKDGRLISSGMLGDPNDMGAVVVMALPFALVPIFEKKTGPFAKMAGGLYAGLAGVVIWLTRSRGTMLAIVAQYLVFRLARTKGSRLGLVLTAVLIGAGYTGLMRLVPRDAGEMQASEESRITFWKSAVNMAVHNPLLGVGFNQYRDNYMSYAVGTIYERGARTAHSSWFLALGESGFVGFFLFVSFFITVVRIAWHNRDKRPAQLYAVAGYGTAMSFLSHTYSQYFYLLMALILASAAVKEKVKNAS